MEIFEDLVAAYRVLAEYGVIDAYGHVSMRSPKNPQRYFIARSLAPEVVQVASAPVQDYKRAWPMWRERALSKAKSDRK